MMEIDKLKWRRMMIGSVNEPILKYLERMFNEITNEGYEIKVFVGTDSQRKRKGYKFASVIIISRYEDLGSGIKVGRGSMVVSTSHYNSQYRKSIDGVKERMIYEVSNSVEVAHYISELLSKYEIPLEVHADINPDEKWESSKAISESVGYLKGMGFDFKVKPDAYAASKVADKASRI